MSISEFHVKKFNPSITRPLREEAAKAIKEKKGEKKK
jgi:hypothetical protein